MTRLSKIKIIIFNIVTHGDKCTLPKNHSVKEILVLEAKQYYKKSAYYCQLICVEHLLFNLLNYMSLGLILL